MMNRLLFHLFFFQVVLGEMTGLEIMTQVKNNPVTKSSITHIELTINKQKKGRTKTKVREFVQYQKNYTSGSFNRKTLIRFNKPALVKGTGLLNWSYKNGNHEQWFFLPKLKIAKKIKSKDRTKTFMGTNFTYEDLESTILNDYNYTSLGIETLFGYPCHVIEAKPKSTSAYSWRKIWIDMTTFQMKQIEFYSSDPMPVKVLSIEKHQKIDGYFVPESMIMRSKNGDNTIMKIIKSNMDAGIQDDLFTQKFLMRIK